MIDDEVYVGRGIESVLTLLDRKVCYQIGSLLGKAGRKLNHEMGTRSVFKNYSEG